MPPGRGPFVRTFTGAQLCGKHAVLRLEAGPPPPPDPHGQIFSRAHAARRRFDDCHFTTSRFFKLRVAFVTFAISAIRIFKEILCVARGRAQRARPQIIPSVASCRDLLGNVLLMCCYPLTVAERELTP